MAKQYVSDTFLAARWQKTRGTIWRWAKVRPDFPKPVKLGASTTRWVLEEIEAWEQSCPKDDHGEAV